MSWIGETLAYIGLGSKDERLERRNAIQNALEAKPYYAELKPFLRTIAGRKFTPSIEQKNKGVTEWEHADRLETPEEWCKRVGGDAYSTITGKFPDGFIIDRLAVYKKIRTHLGKQTIQEFICNTGIGLGEIRVMSEVEITERLGRRVV